MFLFPGFDWDLEGARSLGAAELDGGNIVLYLAEFCVLMFATNSSAPFPYTATAESLSHTSRLRGTAALQVNGGYRSFDRDLEGVRSLGAAEPDGGNIVLYQAEFCVLMFATNSSAPFPYDFWRKAGRTKPFPNDDIYEVSKTNVTINPGCKFAYSRKIIAPVI